MKCLFVGIKLSKELFSQHSFIIILILDNIKKNKCNELNRIKTWANNSSHIQRPIQRPTSKSTYRPHPTSCSPTSDRDAENATYNRAPAPAACLRRRAAAWTFASARWCPTDSWNTTTAAGRAALRAAAPAVRTLRQFRWPMSASDPHGSQYRATDGQPDALRRHRRSAATEHATSANAADRRHGCAASAAAVAVRANGLAADGFCYSAHSERAMRNVAVRRCRCAVVRRNGDRRCRWLGCHPTAAVIGAAVGRLMLALSMSLLWVRLPDCGRCCCRNRRRQSDAVPGRRNGWHRDRWAVAMRWSGRGRTTRLNYSYSRMCI